MSAARPRALRYALGATGLISIFAVVHGGIMAVQALVYPMHRGYLLGDVPALFAIAAVLGVLTPRRG